MQNTDEPEHKARRDLMVEVMMSLGQHPPKIPDFATAPGVTNADGGTKRAVYDMVRLAQRSFQ
eukprot:SAG31_NODE_2236_length_6119_cov_15.764784_3_plen_63_part_00